MKGWLFTEAGVEPRLIEKEDPHAVPGEVVIDVKAAGLCHSDAAALEDAGWMSSIQAAPCIFGRECAGVVAEVGEGVTRWNVGDRVGVNPTNAATGEAIGYHRDGGYATKCLVPQEQLVALPDSVSFVQGAAGADAGCTSYHALFTVGEAKPGMKVGIIGIGGLGQFAAQMAVIRGCEVYAADVSGEARDLARRIGCAKVCSDVRDMAGDAPELIIDYAGFGSTTAGAIEAVADMGTVVVVGMGVLESTINTYLLITKQIRLLGSMGGDNVDLEGVYKLFGTGRLRSQLTEVDLEEVGEGLKRLRAGEVKGRLVAVID